MEYSYISLWTAAEGGKFELRGVIGAGPEEMGSFFPNDEAAMEEGAELERMWESVRATVSPVTWLHGVAKSGNGVTEEYDEVQVVSAPNLQEALQQAYQQTQERYGTRIDLYSENVEEFVDLGDPL